MKRMYLFVFTFLSLASLFAMEEESLFLKKIKKPHFCCYLQTLPQELLQETTFYVIRNGIDKKKNARGLAHIFEHFNPDEKTAQKLIVNYLELPKANIKQLESIFKSLPPLFVQQKLLLMCNMYHQAERNIRLAIETSDPEFLESYMSEATPLIKQINVAEISQQVEHLHQRQRRCSSLAADFSHRHMTASCCNYSISALAIGVSALAAWLTNFGIEPYFNWRHCITVIWYICKNNPHLVNCSISTNADCYYDYAYNNCTTQSQEYYQNYHPNYVKAWVPFFFITSVVTLFQLSLFCSKYWCRARPISQETKDWVTRYQSKIKSSANDNKIEEIV